MDILQQYGWNSTLNQQKISSQFSSLDHGRVRVVNKTCYEVVSEQGVYVCELLGNLLYSLSPFEMPCVGDWVLFSQMDSSSGIIYQILERDKVLRRKKVGSKSEQQVIASHIDKAIIVQSVDDNFNMRRVERFMLQAIDEGIEPVVVLTKCDLPYDLPTVNEELKSLPTQIKVFKTSTVNNDGIDELLACINSGETLVLIGSSGVGKSSLINTLCGEQLLETSSISESTGKGKHTSTRREMILLPNSGVLIDTPGMREFGISSVTDEALNEVFDLNNIEDSCKFQDCTHTSEPGCAVLSALNSGELSEESYNSYMKLKREAWHYSASEHEKRQYFKDFARVIKEAKSTKSPNKG